MNMLEELYSDIKTSEEKYGQLIQTSLYHKSPQEISWRNYIPGIQQQSPYLLEYGWIINKRQYSFLLLNNELIQFFYQFDGLGNLLKARLALYPAPSPLTESRQVFYEQIGMGITEAYSELMLEICQDSFEKDHGMLWVANTSHLRIDYDSQVTSHEKCHLQFGAIQELRITSIAIFSPFQFMTFVIENLYPAQAADLKTKTWFTSTYQNSRKLMTHIKPDRSVYVVLTHH